MSGSTRPPSSAEAPRRRPLVCAHRGASAFLPDNSIAAFEAAVVMGADAIETDVRRARDGRLLLAHDPLPPDPPPGLAELHELVSLAAGRVRLDVELKEPDCERDALAQLDPRPPGLLVTSFVPHVVSAVRRLDPSIRTGLIVGRARRSQDLFAVADACGAHLLVPSAALVNEELCARSLAERRPLVVWTVNSPARLSQLLAEPAVGCVITDVPDVALALMV
jgi:glycerophosphoryl diester phosphodiesterase